MRIKLLQRDPTEHSRTRPQDLQKVSVNADPKLHPFEKPREYTRALNAVKMQRMFAKPFVRALEGHRDSVYIISKHPRKISLLASGSADGEIRLWDLSTGDCLYNIEFAHKGFVRGLTVNSKGQILSAGDDKVIKLWDVQSPTWIPQSDGLGMSYSSDEEDSKDDVLDILRNSNAPSSGSKNTSSTSKSRTNRMDINDDYRIVGLQHSRHGAPIFQSESVMANEGRPIATWLGNVPFSSLSHKWSSSDSSSSLLSSTIFSTTSTELVQVWDYHRSEPLTNLKWESSPDSFLTCAFNPIEHEVLAATASDRSFALFDLRSKSPIRKLTLKMNSNALAWNPMEAFNFTVANEDHNLYTFDMRKLDSALNVHMDHVGPVLDVDYSPTGREIVSGSYDKTIRIFNINEGRSREVYHTKRMQRVFCVKYSLDSSYVISASDDSNMRVWKARSDSIVGTTSARQKHKIYYQNKLVQRYRHMPEIRRIEKKRHLPKDVLVVQNTKNIIASSKRRKLQNMRNHSEEGSIAYIPKRRHHVVAEEE